MNFRTGMLWFRGIGGAGAMALVLGWLLMVPCRAAAELRVGAAAVALEADDSMVIAGGISPGKATGQEGQLRAVATVLELDGTRLAIVACDVLMLTRKTLDPVVAQIERETGIPSAHVLINCTHTHHAPSTMRVHDYDLDPVFTARVASAAAESVRRAVGELAPARFQFHSGSLATVGQNSRQLLDDGQIYWIGPRTNFVRATGPFDPDFTVLAFRGDGDRLRSLIFNHSTHTIGTRSPGRRSPSIYGMAAQEVEASRSGVVTFLEGASGSTHNLDLTGDECINRIRTALEDGLARAADRPVNSLRALKRPLSFRVRTFDEAAEEAAVTRYCRKYAPGYSEVIIPVFRQMRSELAPMQGQERQTWVQVMRIGDVALVGVPAEYFTQLGLDIKNRSPFRYTVIAELANDWIGYLPNQEGHKLGGYQVWTGHHSYAEPGTGERVADLAVEMLRELAGPEETPGTTPGK